MKEYGKIMRDAWEADPKEFVGEVFAALAIPAGIVAVMILAVLIGGK